MSVLMDPLAPAPIVQALPGVSTSASPNPNQQIAQQHGYFAGHSTSNLPLADSRKNSRNETKSIPTSNPDGARDLKQSDRRPQSPSVAETPTRATANKPAGSAVSTMTYKPYFPYGTVPGAGPTSPMRASVAQYSQIAAPGPLPHYQKAHQQNPSHAYPQYRGPSPLNPNTAEAPDQDKIVKPMPISPAVRDQEASAASRDENSGSSSRLYALLNYDSKEQSSKKMKL